MKYRQAKKILKSRDSLWELLPENKKDIVRNTIIKRETRSIHTIDYISDSYYEEYCNTVIDD